MIFDPDIHRRRSVRLQGYDYSLAGTYCVTICTQDHACLFGDVEDGEVHLNGLGHIVNEQWHALPQRFPQLELDAFVIMPNHVHGIFVIVVGAPLAGALDNADIGAHAGRAPARGAPTGNTPTWGDPTVGNIVGAYKSLCVHHALAWIKCHAPGRVLGKIWQRNYWEHIIRNESELNHIREYIQNNPMQWEMDTLHRTDMPRA